MFKFLFQRNMRTITYYLLRINNINSVILLLREPWDWIVLAKRLSIFWINLVFCCVSLVLDVGKIIKILLILISQRWFWLRSLLV